MDDAASIIVMYLEVGTQLCFAHIYFKMKHFDNTQNAEELGCLEPRLVNFTDAIKNYVFQDKSEMFFLSLMLMA